MFEQAMLLYRRGLLADSDRLLETLLSASPGHFDALHLRGLIARQMKQGERAVALLAAAVRENPRVPAAHRHLANALMDLRRVDEAIGHFDHAIRLKPEFVEAHIGRAFALLELERAPAALAGFQRAMQIQPQSAAARLGCGAAQLALGHAAEALASCDGALHLQPDLGEGLILRANALRALGRPAEALVAADRACSVDATNARALAARGAALFDLGRSDESLRSFQQALGLDPKAAALHAGLGSVWLDLQRPEDAVACFERALALNGRFALAWNNLGVARMQLGEGQLARTCYERAMALAPESSEFQLNAAHCLLQLGEFARGWRLYEARPRLGISARQRARREWQGQELSGKTLLLLAEQGLGDTLQFSRFIPHLERLGAHVVLQAPRSLLQLLRTVSSSVSCIGEEEDPPDHDFHLRLMSVPRVLGSRLTSLSTDGPYLSADPQRVDVWRTRLGDHGFRIGIVWQGARTRMDRGRSPPLTAFFPLAAITGVRLISLQKGDGTEQLHQLPAGIRIEVPEGLDEGADAFGDSAAILSCVELVVTSDTSMAHLAGALGRPAWLALQHVPDWRWQLERTDTPWYPRMRLFRQSVRGDWGTVFEQMCSALQPRLAARPTDRAPSWAIPGAA